MSSMNVAIIIPTLNRTHFLMRTIMYYMSIESNHPIYIGDASELSIKNKIDDLVKGRLEINYYHLRDLNDRDTMIFLVREAIQNNIRYCAFQGDDDFLIPESLSVAAEFLNKNINYRTAQGKAAVILLDHPGPYGKVKGLGNYWEKPHLDSESGYGRLKEIASNYWVPNFSVHRSKEFIEDFTDEYIIKDRNWGEITNVFSSAINGKSKYIDTLYLVRNVHNQIIKKNRKEWFKSKEWNSSYESTVLTLAGKLSLIDGIDLTVSEKHVRNALSNYLDRGEKKHSFIKNFIEFCLNLIRASIIGGFLRFVRKKMIEIFFMNKKRIYDVRYMTSKKSYYYDFFSRINDSLKEKKTD